MIFPTIQKGGEHKQAETGRDHKISHTPGIELSIAPFLIDFKLTVPKDFFREMTKIIPKSESSRTFVFAYQSIHSPMHYHCATTALRERLQLLDRLQFFAIYARQMLTYMIAVSDPCRGGQLPNLNNCNSTQVELGERG